MPAPDFYCSVPTDLLAHSNEQKINVTKPSYFITTPTDARQKRYRSAQTIGQQEDDAWDKRL